ncbi:toll/interleukin-1 receptor domain-containing protein [Streptomyces clavuligerus]|uniref:Uncharacterized protein n=1 Tax=Streptomyces clavuligerus TaxID=1901 RepID=B5GRK8_STRCL|nr:toll/interleukin-1 receptor domain-containing protein [Streptomyces clavuligerus]ANW17461.1 hypothetical protein BB341_04085 [Streptomyces clavuligerus]AXU12008.1 TIR domain-containing protein [Streptomyces clavuligerus]EDY48954.1 hypothetical protein SSCG_01982 [Streptomyces clavuligerus]EFG10047.1 Hypothetical protein SCLAV_4974 [Streptomyces clavuligerus]MBY6301861.1 toll/interleukin-1 receptor domain-containing protein [Streptomyces clavuligerus]
MIRPRIFLSHSSSQCSRDGCGCREYLLALEDHLRAQGCEPVVDRHVLGGGDEWNPKLLTEIKKSHGLILLLSPHALDSFYVLQEAGAAAYEHAANPRFLLLPVLLPGVRRRQLRGSRLEQLNLGRFDMVDWSAEAGPGEPPAKIADTLRPLAECLGAEPHPEVTDFLAGRLREVSDTALERTAGILGLATLAYNTGHTRRIVAQGLLTERPVDGPGDPCALRTALTVFLPQVGHSEHRADIVDLVVPYARVPQGDADLLRRLVRGGGERVTLLRASMSQTPGLYVRRASEGPKPWAMRTAVPRHDGTGFAEGVVAEVRDLLRQEIAWGEQYDDDTLRKLLVRHEDESGGPFTVALHQPPDPSLVRLLPAEFPRLLFLFVHRHGAPGPGPVPWPLLQGMSAAQEQDMVHTHRQFRS